MKTAASLLAISLVFFCAVSSCAASEDSKIEATITGIRCQACRAEVTRLLSEVPGVAMVEISGGEKPGEQKVLIRSDRGISETQAREALGEASGFEIISWTKKG